MALGHRPLYHRDRAISQIGLPAHILQMLTFFMLSSLLGFVAPGSSTLYFIEIILVSIYQKASKKAVCPVRIIKKPVLF